MFENSKPQPVAAPIPGPTAKSTVPVQPPPLPVAKHILADQAQVELFKRTGLSQVQKIGLIVITVVVFAILIGGGIWLYKVLDPFSSIVTPTNTNNSNAQNTNSIPLQDLDTDRDGLPDIDEKRYATDLNKADTDEDGLTDYAEIYQHHTSPVKADTDGDGYTDKAELDNGYDPNGPGKL